MNAFLSTRNLSCGYSGKPVIHDLDFNLEKGQILAVIGPNGSGKTTLVRALSRSIQPISGEILLDGRNIRKLSLKELAKNLAVVSQNLDAAALSAAEYVLLGRYPHRKEFSFFESQEDREIAEHYMKLTGTTGLADKTLSETSGGERQLLQIARALTQEPKLIILDEPTSHLDIRHQVGILDLVRKLNRELGITVVMIIHDLNLASEYCDEVLLLHEGRLWDSGDPKSVLSYPNIEAVFGTWVIVKENPLSGKPFIFLVPEENRHLREANHE